LWTGWCVCNISVNLNTTQGDFVIRKNLLACAALVLGAAVAGCAGPANVPAKHSEASVQADIERARHLAGEDLQQLMRLCQAQPAERAQPSAAADEGIRKLIARPAPPPMQVFDNLYYVGGDWVSAWLVKTSQGFILIDTLNNEQEAHALIEGGMAKLGLDPREIKYIVITHGHGDHYGGATYLARKYRAHVVASEDDWKMMHSHLEFDSAVWGRPPARDISVRDGDRLTLGDTTLTMYETPGHTPGTLSPVFDVRSGSHVYHALLWGGTAFNFGKDFGRLEAYEASTERMRRLAMQLPIDVLISNHSSYDLSIPKMKAIAAAHGVGPNPFVIGPAAVGRALQVMGTCARAQEDRFRM
jgi:metallo-beta-lactamase class B